MTTSFLKMWSGAEGSNELRLKVRKEAIAMLIQGGDSEQEATKAVDEEPRLSDKGAADQQVLVQAFGNYLTTVRRAIQDHTGAGALAPPGLGSWPELASLPSVTGSGEAALSE